MQTGCKFYQVILSVGIYPVVILYGLWCGFSPALIAAGFIVGLGVAISELIGAIIVGSRAFLL